MEQEDMTLAILAISVLILIVAIIAVLDAGSANQHLQNINATIDAQVTNSLNPLIRSLNESSNVTLTRDSQVSSKVDNLSNQINNINASMNTKISNSQSDLDSRINTVNANISLIGKNITDINKTIISIPTILGNATNTIKATLTANYSFLKRKIILNESNYTIPTNDYYYGTMLQGFDNHLNYSANESVVLDILTYEQFADLATNKSFSTVQENTGSNQDIWFNQSTGCSAYVFVITGSSTSPFKIKMNDTAVYNKSNSSTGVC